jgi:hypothetical protein
MREDRRGNTLKNALIAAIEAAGGDDRGARMSAALVADDRLLRHLGGTS